jgi:hypothetical protein
MKSIRPSSNWLLQALPAAEFEALAPHLEYIEWSGTLSWLKQAVR